MNYQELTISPENLILESKVFEDITNCISDEKSWVFDAGAGTGKTYALVETLRRIIKQAGHRLKAHNQKILCITYTNVAVNEIKERLGETTLVDVSTIHECVWKIIAQHQNLLIQMHLKKLTEEIDHLNEQLDKEGWANKYRLLSNEAKLLFKTQMYSRIQLYYKYKGGNGTEFRKVFHDIDEYFPGIMSNYTNFKRIVDSLLKIYQFEDTIENINEKDARYTKVRYDARYNNDRLEKMIISHDTLLEYMYKMIEASDLLKQVVCDKNPFILVDEYQDTSSQVIKILSSIEQYSNKIGHTCLIGYYGDIKQNIYDEGVGSAFYKFHKNIVRVEKVFNRRSSEQIISIANKIRNDGLQQKTIYQNIPNGNVHFYNLRMEHKAVVDKMIKEWKLAEDDKIHCFELTNEKVAEHSGFADLFYFYKNSKWYKVGKRFQLLRDHVLRSDEKKLGIVQKMLFRILDFKYRLEQDTTLLLEIFPKNLIKNLNIISLRSLIDKMRALSGSSIKDFIISIFDCYNNGDIIYDKCIKFILAEDINSFDDFKQFIINTLFDFSDSDKDIDETSKDEDTVNKFLELDMLIFKRWYDFITNSFSDKVIYHTYHGTKGWEFDNVIIFMDSSFHGNRDFFRDLLMKLTDKDEKAEAGTELEYARNLLYVAVTRATQNLCIVYSDELHNNVANIESVFGRVKYSLEP